MVAELLPSREHAPGFNPAINGLRGLCALFIFVFHVFNAGIVSWPEDTLLARSGVFLVGTLRFGVEMFFMISGFVIVGSLVRHAALKRFYADRFVRIFSLWMPLHLTICVLGPFLGWRIFESVSSGEWLSLTFTNLLLLPPLLPLPMTHPASWSLSYEWLFYLGAGLVWWLATRGQARTATCVAVSLFALCTIVMPRSLFFAPGVIVFLLRDRLDTMAQWLRYPTVSLSIFLVAWGMADFGIVTPLYESAKWLNPLQWLYAAVAFAAGVHGFACLAARRGHIASMLATPVFQFLGNVSFSFYLISGMVMFAVKKLTLVFMADESLLTLTVFAVVSLLLSAAASWITFMLLEKRFAAWMRRALFGAREAQPSGKALGTVSGRAAS